VLDYADRHGILLIPEIPVWQFSEAQLSDPRVLELARRLMTGLWMLVQHEMLPAQPVWLKPRKVTVPRHPGASL
jgi:hypothetical protein